MKKAIVLWSGGKDCNLALHIAREQGYTIVALVTFYSDSTAFLAHPKAWMELQSKSLGIPHLMISIEEPFAENYELELEKLKSQLAISTVISGDISEVHGNSNWISERAAAAGLEVFLPLWEQERKAVLLQLLDTGFEVLLTMVKAPWLDETFPGRTLDSDLIEEFDRIRSDLKNETQLDLCGENGEYHTMVINGPGYRTPIVLEAAKVLRSEKLFYLTDLQLSLPGDPDTPTLEKHKLCVNCGVPFSCYTQGCWCAELPMIMPMENITDCLCPVCLKAAIDQKQEERNSKIKS